MGMERKAVNGPWKQGLYEITSEATEMVGTLRQDIVGNRYHYARAGGTALAASKMTSVVPEDADWVSEAASSFAVGARTLTLTIVAPGATGVNSENYFRGGQIQMTDGTAEGIRYPIVFSSAVAAAGTSITVTLDQGLVEAVTSGTEFTLTHSPYMETVISATITDPAAGVPLVDVTADYYYWTQTGGEALCFGGDTAAIGTEASLHTTDGSLGAAVSFGTSAITTAPVGVFMQTNVDGEYIYVRLYID